MKAADLQAPEVLATVLAVQGLTNTIPVNDTGSYLASQILGFPPITMQPQENGGEAPDGKDFNGLLKLISSHNFNMQNGGLYTFNQSVSDAIGGYPNQSSLWYLSESGLRLLQSTKDDNTDNFITNPSVIGTSWVDAIPTVTFVDEGLSKRKFINYEGVRNVNVSGNITIQLQDNDEIIQLSISNNATITFDLSQLSWTKEYSTIQLRFIFTAGAKTIGYAVPGRGPLWIGGNVADFGDAKAHWVVLRNAQNWTTFLLSDAGTEG